MTSQSQNINEINKHFSNELWLDFEVTWIKGNTLFLKASRDFSYYHLLELKFHDVFYFQGPFSWSTSPNSGVFIRMLDGEDLAKIMSAYEITHPGIAVAITTDNQSEIYICAAEIELDFATVYYYKRENLAEGERILNDN